MKGYNAMNIELLFQTVAELESGILSEYPTAQAIELGSGLDRAIIIPPKSAGPCVALVAHTDTVFARPLKPSELGCTGSLLYSKSDKFGLGADDRAGISACLALWRELDNVAVILCPNEETGCNGSRALSIEHIDSVMPSELMQFCIQFDRRGARDIVAYDVADELVGYIAEYMPTYSQARGSFSDICELCPTLGVQGVNLSIGYDNEHTPNETLDILDYSRTVDLVRDMLQTVGDIPRFDLDTAIETDDDIELWDDYASGYNWSDYYYGEESYSDTDDDSELDKLKRAIDHIYESDSDSVDVDIQALGDMADQCMSDIESGALDLERAIGPVYDAYDLIGDDSGLDRAIILADQLNGCRPE